MNDERAPAASETEPPQEPWGARYSREAPLLESGKISALALLLWIVGGCAMVWLLARLA